MPLAAAVALGIIAMISALRGGRTDRHQMIAWIAGVVAVNSAAALMAWSNSTDWDDPDAPNRWPVDDTVIAAIAIGLSAAHALWLRRPAVLYLALPVLVLMVWLWLSTIR